MERRRQELVHREMVGAFTTAAVVNCAPIERKEPAKLLEFMPSHRDADHTTPPAKSDEALELETEYNLAVLRMSIQMRANEASNG
jgi:hypothetical protein